MKNTITMVYPQPRAWGDKYPNNCSVMVQFKDGSMGDIGTKKDKAEAHKEALFQLIGKESEFTTKGDPKEFQGVTTYNIADYPGNPVASGQGGGGGGRQYTPSWANTEEGEKYVQERTDRRTALMQAVAWQGEMTETEMLAMAECFYSFLRKPVSDAPKPVEPPVSRSNGQNAAQQATDGEKHASGTIAHHRHWAGEDIEHRGSWLKEFIAFQQTFAGRFGPELSEDREFVLFVLRRIFPKKRITSRKQLLPEELAEAREAMVRWQLDWIDNAKRKWTALQREQQGQEYQEAEG